MLVCALADPDLVLDPTFICRIIIKFYEDRRSTTAGALKRLLVRRA